MHVDDYYNEFWKNALEHFEQGRFEYDNLVDDPNDGRRGLTVLVCPSDDVKEEIGEMLNDLSTIEPNQYYYPVTDMHVTILSVVSCYDGFTLSSVNARDYIDVIQQSLTDIPPFNILFKGITASPSCIMVQGYPDETLNVFRDSLRENFRDTGLEMSFDTRYTIVLAHSTVMRFKQPPAAPQKFINKLWRYRQHSFGSTMFGQVELVFNDWYQRSKNTTTLATFNL